MKIFLLFVTILVTMLIYFFPAIISIKTNTREATIIFLINMITGFTIIGWVICLIWALSNSDKTIIKELNEKRQLGIITTEEYNEKISKFKVDGRNYFEK